MSPADMSARVVSLEEATAVDPPIPGSASELLGVASVAFDFALGAFDMDCGCMKRPARVAACSRGGVENGSVKLDIPASRGLLR